MNGRIGNNDLMAELGSVKSILERKGGYDPQEHNDKTRSNIATNFVSFYFTIVFIVVVCGMIYDMGVGKDPMTKEILGLIGTLIGSPLGFVLGYYFKSQNGKE